MAYINKMKTRTGGVTYDLRDANVVNLFANRAERNGHFNAINLGTVANQSQMNELISDWGLTSLTEMHPDIGTGAYIQINDGTYNKPWLIAGFDTENNKGSTNIITAPSVTIQPRVNLTTSPMYSTNVTYTTNNTAKAGGYYASVGRSKVNEIATAMKNSIFGSHLGLYDKLISNTVNSSTPSMAGGGQTGASTSWEWVADYMTLPTEVQTYGATVWSSSAFDVGEGYEKLPVYNFIHPVTYGREHQWLRAVVSGTCFAFVSYGGNASYGNASSACGLRPLAVLV